ncbi:hypothetical protein IV203_001189 [Nitzschia inconspicua]|uniref:Uncharacterized protein n=1 Tax=Nitzschia inconspicua TaxID=303405 RepID=A0A9K3PRD9_9STRA|nr:hypothetical protein IV203_001189 [Nitzschia inconspicua]
MSDDEEPNVSYRDARDGLLTSAADKQRKALNHFTYFLKGYCVQIGIHVVEAKYPTAASLQKDPTKLSSSFGMHFWAPSSPTWEAMQGAVVIPKDSASPSAPQMDTAPLSRST